MDDRRYCDAVGATWNGQQVGTFGDLATVSFYPAHQMTIGEGGAVMTLSPLLRKLVESYRDWGRDCWCQPGKDNTCGKRFEWQLGDLPHGYDHKYTYSHIGCNLKLTDMQAAVGCAQLEKLDGFVAARRANAHYLTSLLADIPWLALPRDAAGGQSSWFGYPLRVLASAASIGTHPYKSSMPERSVRGCYSPETSSSSRHTRTLRDVSAARWQASAASADHCCPVKSLVMSRKPRVRRRTPIAALGIGFGSKARRY
jgi:dTDP-4-amino-4,6-dideoxygalactose transaminase